MLIGACVCMYACACVVCTLVCVCVIILLSIMLPPVQHTAQDLFNRWYPIACRYEWMHQLNSSIGIISARVRD